MTPVSSSVIYYTSVVTETPSSTGGTASPTIIYITSTAAPTPTSSSVYYSSPVSSGTASSSSTRSSALATVGADSSKSSGLSSGGTIAVAVVVPIAAIVLLVLGLIFFWRKRKARKAAEEQRKKEIEEYGFNPNHDPTLAPVGAAAYAGNDSEMTEDNSGYRGWGAASTQRKPSTHLSSGRGGGGGGAAVSETSSNPGGYGYQGSPSNGTTAAASEGHPGEPLVNPDTMGALVGAGAAGGAVGRRQSNKDIHRGPSNASSAYSTGRAQSQVSDDMAVPGAGPGAPGPYYHEEGPYFNEAQPQHGPYGDGSYGGEQPIIRDVQARRNTRIERAPTFPQQQGNSGVATNF